MELLLAFKFIGVIIYHKNWCLRARTKTLHRYKLKPSILCNFPHPNAKMFFYGVQKPLFVHQITHDAYANPYTVFGRLSPIKHFIEGNHILHMIEGQTQYLGNPLQSKGRDVAIVVLDLMEAQKYCLLPFREIVGILYKLLLQFWR